MGDLARNLFGLLIALTLMFSLQTHSFSQNKGKMHRHWNAGPYTFSDELGGFGIVNVAGRGTHDDPVIITQDVFSIGKSIITIRQTNAFKTRRNLNTNWTTMHIRFRTLNRSPASWIGFRFELQEELGKASIYGDGLSFNQLTRDESDILSNRFMRYEVEHEPGDRLVFNDGWVDQSDEVEFTVFLLDLTPTSIFYIEQVPFLPAS